MLLLSSLPWPTSGAHCRAPSPTTEITHARSTRKRARRSVQVILGAFVAALALTAAGPAFALGGTVDEAFSAAYTPGAAGSPPYDIALSPDGSIVGVGDFGLERWNADGSLDAAFGAAHSGGFDGIVKHVTVAADGSIYVAGGFTHADNAPSPGLARFDSNGAVDTAFGAALGIGVDAPNGRIYAIAATATGVDIGGLIWSFNGIATGHFVALTSAGIPDAAVQAAMGTGFNAEVQSITIQPDGSAIVGGNFGGATVGFNGMRAPGLARISAAGVLDTAFEANLGEGFDAEVDDSAVQADGAIVVVGLFQMINNIPTPYVGRVGPDGTPDVAFGVAMGTGPSSYASRVEVQANGGILVGDDFARFNGTDALGFVRLEANGEFDTAFQTSLGAGPSFFPSDAAVAADDSIIVAGDFQTFNGITSPGLVRLLAVDPQADEGPSLAATGVDARVPAMVAAAVVLIGLLLLLLAALRRPGVASSQTQRVHRADRRDR